MRRFVGAIAVVAATSVVLFGAQPAYATYPGKNGRISFRRYLNARHSWGAIFTINPDGSGERQVTHPKRGVLTWQQDWSPDGRWIAYQREGGPGPFDDIFKIRANGKDKTYLSASCIDSCKADNTPFWSPDGTLISFTRFFTTCPRTGFCGFTAIFTMRTDGSDLHQVTQVGTTPDQRGYEDYSPIWSPDGRWIAFRTHEKSDEIGDIGLVRPDGKDLHLITSGKGKWASCSFSPNGKRIVGAWPAGGLPRNADLWAMQLNGSHLRNVTKSAETWESAPDWGPRAK
jgi:Tol biopolymer transport system component